MLTLIHSVTAQDATETVQVDNQANAVSQSAKLIVHVHAITGTWGISAQIHVGTPARFDVMATSGAFTATGIVAGTAATDYDTFGEGIPRPVQLAFNEVAEGELTADIYWLTEDD